MSEVNTDKPCPFCGNAVIQTTVDDGCHWHSCPKCSATGPTEFLRSDEDSPGWNTRPDFDAQRLRADTAEAELATQDRVLRASVPEEHRSCASPVGAVQSYICDLEEHIAELVAAFTPLLKNWDDLAAGESLNVDRARAALNSNP